MRAAPNGHFSRRSAEFVRRRAAVASRASAARSYQATPSSRATDAEAMRPLLEVANRHRAVLFIHHGPRPGDAFPKVAGDTDNARRRNGTLDMQASLSSVMVTLCLTDYLASYPDAMIHIHNLGGNIPYEVERMDHRSLLDTPTEELPSSRFRKAKVYVDCNSFGPRRDRSGREPVRRRAHSCAAPTAPSSAATGPGRRLAEAQIGEQAREQILHAMPRRCWPASRGPRRAKAPSSPSVRWLQDQHGKRGSVSVNDCGCPWHGVGSAQGAARVAEVATAILAASLLISSR